MSEVEPIKLGYGVSGWKARQNRARQKMSKGKSHEEREAIREARRRLYEQQENGQAVTEEAPAVDQDSSGDDETVEMTRDEMIQALKDAGQTVGPNTKDETLAKRVEALYEIETETKDGQP